MVFAIAALPLQSEGSAFPSILTPLSTVLVPLGHQFQSRCADQFPAPPALGKDWQTRELGLHRLPGPAANPLQSSRARWRRSDAQQGHRWLVLRPAARLPPSDASSAHLKSPELRSMELRAGRD